MKRFRPLDFLIIITSIAFSIFFIVNSNGKKGELIKVTANGILYEYTTKSNGIYSVEGELGQTVFEIKDGRVHIIDSSCPEKICVHQGYTSTLVCLPNKVIITVEAEGDFDAVSQ